jgi:hypothetical protein
MQKARHLQLDNRLTHQFCPIHSKTVSNHKLNRKIISKHVNWENLLLIGKNTLKLRHLNMNTESMDLKLKSLRNVLLVNHPFRITAVYLNYETTISQDSLTKSPIRASNLIKKWFKENMPSLKQNNHHSQLRIQNRRESQSSEDYPRSQK